MNGVFISVEGVEGSGKSTQILRLSERLRRLGVPVTASKEPGGTPLGSEVRRLLLTHHSSGESWCPDAELLLFYADRAQHLAQVIRPALAEGRVVLLDRFEDSTRAYQGALGVPEATLDRLSELVVGRTRPHLTLLLDMDPESSLVRVDTRNLDLGEGFRETRYDEKSLAFHRLVRSRFLAIHQKEPNRVRVIPARLDPGEVEREVWRQVAPLLRNAGFRVE
ncbi:MAG: dTMP kinase [Acidobacteria bacterium]|nr:dTMP kinase [Acidobacteriota bacterium]